MSSLIIKSYARLIGCIYSESSIAQAASKNIPAITRRYFSTSSELNHYIGPAPSQPVLPGEPGYDLFVKSVEFHTKHGRDTIFTQADIERLKNSQQPRKDDSFFLKLIEIMQQNNAEMRQLNKNIQDLLRILGPKNP